jgi:hypothetical protein
MKIYTSKTNCILIEHEDGTYAITKGSKETALKVRLVTLYIHRQC